MNFIDLSQPLNEKTPVYPGDEKTIIRKSRTFEKDFYTAFEVSLSMHTSTHIDAPMHMLECDKTIDLYDISSFFGDACIIDAEIENEIIVYKSEYEYDKLISEGSIVLIHTGYDRYYSDEKKYFTSHPSLSNELTEFLIRRKIKMVGIDMPSPDHYPFNTHKRLLNNSIFILENLCNLHKIAKNKKITLSAFPLKIATEASIVRAVAIVE